MLMYNLKEIDKNDLYSNNNINKKIDIEQNNIYEATIQPNVSLQNKVIIYVFINQLQRKIINIQQKI